MPRSNVNFNKIDVPQVQDFHDLGYDNQENWFTLHDDKVCTPTTRSRSQGQQKPTKSTQNKENVPVVQKDVTTTKAAGSSQSRVSAPTGCETKKPVKSGRYAGAITIPRTPRLATLNRNRPVLCDTPQTRENKMLAQQKKDQFKATQLPTKLLENPMVPKVEHKHTVHFNEPALVTRTRAQHWEVAHPRTPGQTFEFHANPMPDYTEISKIGVAQVPEPTRTIPKTPNIHKAPKRKTPTKSPIEVKTFARPPPHFGTPFQPKSTRATTKVQPFSFEQRSKDAFKRFPSSGNKDSEDYPANTFKARKVPTGSPFVPDPASASLTRARDSLAPHGLEHRMESRKLFDEETRELRDKMEKLHVHRLRLESQKRRQSARIKTSRFKAAKVRNYRRVSIHKSAKPATNPKSPKFSARLNFEANKQ